MDYYHFNDITEINEKYVINHIGENLKTLDVINEITVLDVDVRPL